MPAGTNPLAERWALAKWARVWHSFTRHGSACCGSGFHVGPFEENPRGRACKVCSRWPQVKL